MTFSGATKTDKDMKTLLSFRSRHKRTPNLRAAGPRFIPARRRAGARK